MTHFKKSLCGCAECTLQKLFANTLKMLNVSTKNAADHLALKPSTTIMQAARPTMVMRKRPMDHEPWITKPTKRKMRRTRPARRKLIYILGYYSIAKNNLIATYYFLRSESLIDGKPANLFLLLIIESLKTMNNPPTTLKLRKKNVRSKIKP